MRIPTATEADWIKARTGRITASKAHLVMTGGHAGLTTYLEELRIERKGAQSFAHDEFPATSWGHEYEPEARKMFALVSGLPVKGPPLFYAHDSYPDELGASPDGVVTPTGYGDEFDRVGIPVEIKCPWNQDIHRQQCLAVPSQYYAQLSFQMWIMSAPYGYFVSYDPRAKDDDGNRIGDLHYVRVDRDQAFIQTLEQKTMELREHLLNGTNPEAFDVLSAPPKLF